MNLWDILNNITLNKKDIKEDIDFKKDYNAFMINRGLSYFPDTIMYANEINLLSDLDNDLQYDYLINIIRPRKRFSKWAKKEDGKDLELVMNYFNYNVEKAKTALSILTDDDIKKIEQKMNKGG
jgi:hypothetical protein